MLYCEVTVKAPVLARTEVQQSLVNITVRFQYCPPGISCYFVDSDFVVESQLLKNSPKFQKVNKGVNCKLLKNIYKGT